MGSEMCIRDSLVIDCGVTDRPNLVIDCGVTDRPNLVIDCGVTDRPNLVIDCGSNGELAGFLIGDPNMRKCSLLFFSIKPLTGGRILNRTISKTMIIKLEYDCSSIVRELFSKLRSGDY